MKFQNIVFILIFLLVGISSGLAQTTPITNYAVNNFGQAELSFTSQSNYYYVLKVRKDVNSPYRVASKMALGSGGQQEISESLRAYPLDHYQLLGFPKSQAQDVDNDGRDDMTEFNAIPTQSPLNAAPPVNTDDGEIYMKDFADYKRLSIRKEWVQFSEYLNGLGHFKYMITDFFTDTPHVYFINTNKYRLHQDFAQVVGENHLLPTTKKGEIVYHPTSVSANGTLGTFAFNYTGGHGEDFYIVQRTQELLAANMPFIKNNLTFFVTDNSKDEYNRDLDSFQASRVSVLLEEDVYADVNYWGLNQTEGYGLFRKMNGSEIPGAKDIVLYDALPNALPRVGGIITSVLQTPLSHVNLRAIQDQVPNAFIREPLEIDSIAELLDKYIYFKVEQNNYIIREASQSEVNSWYEKIRPKEGQTPPLNLCYKEILPLSKIGFKMFDGFGAKCANLATMRTFNFPEGTIPNGYGVPFYFYQEFMKYNGFYKEIAAIVNEPSFKANRLVRDIKLKAFRKKIKNASMPEWMLSRLSEMHKSFPVGTAVRCRSSTNNEDLPGFNGAGLYTSKTQHLDEGHISKSIKQVYASLWNLRAFEERDFYRVDHMSTAMGVLCHPNFSNELSNGVGVSTDPLYNTENTFYLNSQIGEQLITNPDTNAHPEEILLDRTSVSSNDYIVIQRSNLIPSDSVILTEDQLDKMREFLGTIHTKFKEFYKAEGQSEFAMDIEYKITSDNQLAIKQARPWVSYVLDNKDGSIIMAPTFDITAYPNPAEHCINLECMDCNIAGLSISDLSGKIVKQKTIANQNSLSIHIGIEDLPMGLYILNVYKENNQLIGTVKFLKQL